MPTNDSFEPLKKVTRLYLSQSEEGASRAESPSRCTEVILWLAASGKGFNRAFVSVGLAESFSRLGLNVTLVEVSSALPNIGYYFSLEPEDYLLGTIEENHFFVGNWFDSVQYAFGMDISRCFGCIDRFVPQRSPHIVILSFPIFYGEAASGLIFELRKLGRKLLLKVEKEDIGIPDLIFVACKDEGDEASRLFIDTVRSTFQEPLINRAVLSSGEDELIRSDRSIYLPAEVFFGSHRRVPPKLRTFDEMATSMLEFIGTRRKRAKRERTRSR